MKKKNMTVAVGLSGGVDSSVAAALLQDQGYDVVGIIMEIYDGTIVVEGSGRHACYGPDEKEDIASAAAVSKKLNIPFHVIDLKKEYNKHVLAYFREEYLSGRTPNPCIVCNQKLKFGFLLEKAKQAGIDFDYFATGHYARIKKCQDRFLLKKASYLKKDQTYFLYALSQEQLSRTLFPLGGYSKSQVREAAESLGLETAERPESQDFISGNDYSVLFDDSEVKEGDIVNENGDCIGRHSGIINYTVGQRRGLGVASKQPLYVVKIDAENNKIIAGDKEKLLSNGLIASDLKLISLDKLEKSVDVKIKIRLNHKGINGTVSPQGNNKAKVVFKEPQLSVTAGQSAVFYVDDIVLGGGVIETVF